MSEEPSQSFFSRIVNLFSSKEEIDKPSNSNQPSDEQIEELIQNVLSNIGILVTESLRNKEWISDKFTILIVYTSWSIISFRLDINYIFNTLPNFAQVFTICREIRLIKR